jgi:predicted transcriptional regulator
MPMKYARNGKKTNLLQIRVSDADLEQLDKIAAKERRTRSEVVRMLITGGVSCEKENKQVAI